MRHSHWLIAFGALGCALGCGASPGVVPLTQGIHGKADGPLDAIVAPTESVLNRTYAEWSTGFWRWQMKIDTRMHPLIDDTHTDCSVGQEGSVWFVGGSFDPSPKTRNCTVPKDTYLFSPVEAGECSTMEGNGTTHAQLADCAKALSDMDTILEAKLDGVAVPGLEDPINTKYRVISDIFSWEVPEKNIAGEYFGVMPYPPAGTVTTSVADGKWLMLRPLSPGAHTLFIHGGAPGYEFFVTYNLTVQP